VAVADGGRARSAGRVATTPEELALFAASLAADDRVVLEATGNALAIAKLIAPHVAEVVLAHAKQVRAISHARIKTDKFDARVLGEPMEPLTVTLRQTKETKNTVRYEEPESDQPTVIGTLYLQKWAVRRLDDPETITVTIAPARPVVL